MPTARKLPSGSWRCQVFSHYESIIQEDGSIKKKRIYKSFTSDDPSRDGKKMAELEATKYAAEKKQKKSNCNMTLGEAIDEYISQRSSVLSPRTIMDYKRTRRNDLQGLMEIKISDITQDDIQESVNIDAKKHSPKTVRNNHGLVSAVLHVYRPEFALNTDLPQKVRPNIYVPSDEEVSKLIDHIKGTEMELPVLLAAFGPMRRGEICALHTKDIKDNVVHVCCNMICTEDRKWIIWRPKSYAGDRCIDYPDFVAELWKEKTGRVTELNPNNITDRFRGILESAGLPHFRFHDLRHYSASIQHALGIPDSYIMERGGWGNDGVLKSVYRHAMDSKKKEMNEIANKHFSELCNTKCNTKQKKA